MKKIYKIGAAVLAFILIGFILFITNSFVGNPISKASVESSVKKYIAETYPNQNFTISRAEYNFKFSNYFVKVKSKTSVDTHFTITCSRTGKIQNDNYDISVLRKFNTWERFNSEYHSLVDKVIKKDFPYKSQIYYGELYDKDEEHNTLILDMPFNVQQIQKAKSKLVIYSESDIINEQVLAERLLFIKDIFDKNKVPFGSIDCVIEKPRTKGEFNDESMRVENFLYDDIHKDGLTKKVKENNEAVNQHYAELDKEKAR